MLKGETIPRMQNNEKSYTLQMRARPPKTLGEQKNTFLKVASLHWLLEDSKEASRKFSLLRQVVSFVIDCQWITTVSRTQIIVKINCLRMFGSLTMTIIRWPDPEYTRAPTQMYGRERIYFMESPVFRLTSSLNTTEMSFAAVNPTYCSLKWLLPLKAAPARIFTPC